MKNGYGVTISKPPRFSSYKKEGFSIECRKTKTKVMTTANQNKGKFHKEPMRT